MNLSVAMATYNGASFIQEQLDSFLDQTRRPDELVVTDDGSTDDTLAILDRFSASAPFPVHVHRNPDRLNYSRNFERAISRCSGDIIFISDQDDVWFPEKIARASSVFETEASVLVTVNDQLIVNANGETSGDTIFGNTRRACLPDTHLIAGSCSAIARPLLQVLIPFPDGIPYDSWIGLVSDSLVVKRLIELPLQVYRRHERNTTQPSVVESPNRWAEVKKYGVSNSRNGWTDEARWRRDLVDRLRKHGHEIERFTKKGAVELAIAANERRIDAIMQRILLMDEPRWRRCGAVLRAWRAGLYREFRGRGSALKDLLRP